MSLFGKWPVFSEQEIAAVSDVLSTGKVNYWTGEQCKLFEDEFALYHQRKYGISLANGTVALELALVALGLSCGDDVIVPSRTYFATASSVVARGGTPIPADVDLKTQNLTVDTIKSAMTQNTKGVIVVHLGGWPCEIAEIKAFCKSNSLFLVEDCAQAHGAMVDGLRVGSFGDCAAFSFCQDKIISTGGEGGMLLLDDEEMWKNAWAFKDHGKSHDAVYKQVHSSGFKWLHTSFGTNWRMTEMQAAIGRSQLLKLESWIAERQHNAKILNDGLSEVPGLAIAVPDQSISHAYYRYYAFIKPKTLLPNWSQIRIIESINEQGVPCFVGSCGEIYKEAAFQNNPKFSSRSHENAQYLFETSLAFLVHPGISKAALEHTVAVVKNVMEKATRI